MKNYMKVSLEENAPRVELHDKLGLTGAEISINTLPAGECVPFIHSHKQNEEVYYILSGSGKKASPINAKTINDNPIKNKTFTAGFFTNLIT